MVNNELISQEIVRNKVNLKVRLRLTETDFNLLNQHCLSFIFTEAPQPPSQSDKNHTSSCCGFNTVVHRMFGNIDRVLTQD